MIPFLSTFRAASGALLLATIPVFPVLADPYSEFVTGLQPDIYYRLDEDAISTPEPPEVGSSVVNLGMGGSAMDGLYQTLEGSLVETTGPSGGAIAGNAGVEISGMAVRLPKAALASGKTPFSLSIWVMPTSSSGGILLGHGDALPNGNALLLVCDATGQIILDRFGETLLASKNRLVAGAWNAVGVTYDGEKTLKLFINGLLDSTHSGDIAEFGNLFAAFGDNYWLPAQGWQFSGGLDEFAYWNGSTLTDKQMVRLADPASPKRK